MSNKKNRAFDQSKWPNWIDPKEVIPYDKNAKLHDERQVRNVANSIRRFGWQQDTVITRDKVLVIGHCRRLAALQLGCMLPYHVIDKDADELTDEDIKELRLADNLTNESPWDYALGALDMEGLEFDGFDFDFDDFVLPDDDDPQDIVEDEAPEAVETRCKLGDIWKLGNHRLICGDSTDITVIDRLMDGVKADMVFTDPPYGMKYTSHRPKEEVRFEMLQNDDKILDFFPCIEMFSKGFVFVCTTWKVLDEWLPLFKKYLDLSNMIIWNKGGGGIGDLKTTFSVDYEIILCASRKNEIKGKRIGSVWDCGRDNAIDYKHPTQKPIGLSSIAIEHTTEKNDIVLDLFGGSGSTLIACEQLNRKCFMCELDPHYCDVIIQRWENFTGEKAVFLSG